MAELEISKAQRTIGFVLGLLCIAFGCSYAFYQLATRIAYWDDEGYMLLCLQHYLQVGGLYVRTYAQYGPFYFFVQQFLHSVFNLPVTHDAGRVITLIHWTLSCSLAGLILWRMTRDFLWSGLAFLSMALLTWPLSQGPGHPQEVVLWLLLLPLLCATFFDTRFRAVALAGMGTVGACLVFTKINIGAFYCFAVLQMFTYLTLQGKAKRVAATVLMAITILMPRVLMNYYFHEWAFRLCLFTILVTFAMTLAGSRVEQESTLPGNDWLMTAAGFTGAAIVILGLAFRQGSSALDLLHGIVLDPLAHPHVFHFEWVVQLRFVGFAIVCVAILIFGGYRANLARAMKRWNFLLQIFGGLISLFWMVARGREGLLFSLVLAPLVLINASQRDLRYLFPRMTVAFVAVFQIMQAYPVAGSQVYIAAAPALVWALVAIWDGLHSEAIAECFPVIRISTRRWIVAPLIPALLLLLAAYRRGVALGPFAEPPSGLPGANMIHMNREQARIYRQVASTVHEQCDTLFTMPGMGSFNFWSHVPPPDGFNLTAWMTGFSEKRQRSILNDLEHSTRPCVLYNPMLVTFWMPNGTQALHDSPLANYVFHETRAISHVGNFQIRVPAKVTGGN